MADNQEGLLQRTFQELQDMELISSTRTLEPKRCGPSNRPIFHVDPLHRNRIHHWLDHYEFETDGLRYALLHEERHLMGSLSVVAYYVNLGILSSLFAYLLLTGHLQQPPWSLLAILIPVATWHSAMPFARLRGIVRLFISLRKISHAADKIASRKVKRMKRGGLLVTIDGSRYHDTILTDEKSVSSHITRDYPGGVKEYLERSEIEDAALKSILQRSVKLETELPESKRVFILDGLVVFRLAVALLLMNPERRAAMVDGLKRGGMMAAQDALIGMASRTMFGFTILSKVRLKDARRKGHDACVLDYQGKMHLASIKETTVVIAERMDGEALEGLAEIVKYHELMRYLILDEEHLLGPDIETRDAFRKQLSPGDSDK